jgi:hypothetical protein
LDVERPKRGSDSAADPGDAILQRVAEERDPASSAQQQPRSPLRGRAQRVLLAIASELSARFSFDFGRFVYTLHGSTL